MDTVQQGVYPLPTQMETPIWAARPLKIGHQIGGAMLRASHTFKPARFQDHRSQAAEEIRHNRLWTGTVDKVQLELLQELHPENLAG